MWSIMGRGNNLSKGLEVRRNIWRILSNSVGLLWMEKQMQKGNMLILSKETYFCGELLPLWKQNTNL